MKRLYPCPGIVCRAVVKDENFPNPVTVRQNGLKGVVDLRTFISRRDKNRDSFNVTRSLCRCAAKRAEVERVMTRGSKASPAMTVSPLFRRRGLAISMVRIIGPPF